MQAMEMWILRRIMKIPWTARKTNDEVLRMANESRGLIKHIRERQLSFLGHALRRKQIEHLSLSGKFEGKRARGRPRQKYLDTLIQDIQQQMTPGRLM